MDKGAIRNLYIRKRRELKREDIRRYSEQITEYLLEFLHENPHLKHIHLFLPIDRFHEVDTYPLFYKLQVQGFHLYTSAVNKEKDNLDTLDITDIREFKSDSWGIPVPVGANPGKPESIQVVLIPLLAYDLRGFRIGYGKGYYDKYLSSMSQEVLKIGISFFPPMDELPKENHDVPLDLCVTPEGRLSF